MRRTTPTPRATARVVGDLERIRALWRDGARVFGALDGDQLVGATVIHQSADHGETEFTSVSSAYRGKGVGQGVKAASVLALVADGIRIFGTGGAALNDASLGANLALGYLIEERWRSYAPPAATEG